MNPERIDTEFLNFLDGLDDLPDGDLLDVDYGVQRTTSAPEDRDAELQRLAAAIRSFDVSAEILEAFRKRALDRVEECARAVVSTPGIPIAPLSAVLSEQSDVCELVFAHFDSFIPDHVRDFLSTQHRQGQIEAELANYLLRGNETVGALVLERVRPNGRRAVVGVSAHVRAPNRADIFICPYVAGEVATRLHSEGQAVRVALRAAIDKYVTGRLFYITAASCESEMAMVTPLTRTGFGPAGSDLDLLEWRRDEGDDVVVAELMVSQEALGSLIYPRFLALGTACSARGDDSVRPATIRLAEQLRKHLLNVGVNALPLRAEKRLATALLIQTFYRQIDACMRELSVVSRSRVVTTDGEESKIRPEGAFDWEIEGRARVVGEYKAFGGLEEEIRLSPVVWLKRSSGQEELLPHEKILPAVLTT